MLGTILRNKWATLIVGLLLIGGGFYYANKTDVTCGSAVMQEGDTCTTTRHGIAGDTKSLAEQRDSDQLAGRIGMGAGGLMTVGSIVFIVISSRRKKAAEAVTSSPVAAA